MEKKIYIGNTFVGQGVFTEKAFKEGEEILRFEGPTISFEQGLAKGEEQANTLQIGPDRYIDPLNIGKFVNHSCQPNAGIKNDLILVAIEDINEKEEILFDYSTTMDEDYWTMECRCGSGNCRKIIKDFKYLPDTVKQKYLELSIVQNFIAMQCH